MARLLSHFLSSSSSSSAPFKLIPITFSLTLRNRSTRSGKVQFIEIDLESSTVTSSSSSSSSSLLGDSDVLAIKKLDEFVHKLTVQRSTPDWIPFVPGSSFWVPPRRRRSKVVDLFDKLSEPFTGDGEGGVSLITAHGWPCSDFFTKDSGGDSTLPDVELKASTTVESDMEVKVPMSTEISNHPDDDKK